MRAVTIERFGEHGAVRELPDPEPGEREVLVRVVEAGVNPVDWKARDGKAGERTMPMVLGQDFAGVVERVGPGVRDYAPGDRVFGIAREHGSFTECTVAPVDAHDQPIAPIPAGVSDAQAAALPTPGLTALASLEILGVREGTTLLIHGATGGVGAFATQLARERGAQIVATVKSGAADARALGADEVIDGEDGDVVAAVRRAHPEGVDAVLDLVSTDADTNFRFADVLRPGGALVTTNHIADEKRFQARGLRATNITMNETPQSSTAGLLELAQRVARGALEARVAAEKQLGDAPDVLDASKSGELHGKVVLAVTPSRQS